MNLQGPSQKNRTFQVRELISVENSPELLTFKFKYDNILIWPFVRHMVLQGAINEMFSLKNPHAKIGKQSVVDLLRYIYTTVTKSPFCIDKKTKTDILFFSSGIVNVKEDDKYVNRIYDDFAFEYADRTLIIEDSCRYRYYHPRNFSKVYYHYLISLLVFPGSFLKKTCRSDEVAIEGLISYLKNNFVYKFQSNFWNEARRVLHKVSSRLPRLHKLYLKLFNNIRPKIIFLEDANYGRKSYIIKWAKDLRIITAEVQHGAILQEHPAYNYGDAVFKSEYVNYLPDFYLSNGKFWSDSLTTPSKAINIGNPYLSNKLANFQRNRTGDNRYKLLIISGGTAPESLMNLMQTVLNILPPQDFKFIFRPHPSEMPFANSRYKYVIENKIEFDRDSLYKTLEEVDGVLSAEFSTAIFEAAIFGKDVYVLKTPLFTYHYSKEIFNYFDTPQELYKLVTDRNKTKCDPKILLDSNWRSNYRSFINKVVYDLE